MSQPCPPHWTFAARAAYFGDRMCPFCEHRNPAGAKFCNDCASPLHLKPCNQCNAVNEQAAKNCYNCGAACPASFSTSEATPALPSGDAATAQPTSGDVAVTATVTQAPLVATPALRAHRPLLGSRQLLVASIATILIAAAYSAYHFNAVTPGAIEVAPEPIGAREYSAPAVTPIVAVSVEPKPVEPPVEADTTPAFPAPIPAVNPEAPKRASAGQRAVTVPATKRASAQHRPAPERRTPAGATARGTHGHAAAPVGVPVAEVRKKPTLDRWQAMHVSLARCSGDWIDRILCDQRVRRHYCEGHWGKAADCASGVVNEHGQ